MCEFCKNDGSNTPLVDTRKGGIVIEYGELNAYDFGTYIASVKINYCPICGAKIERRA